MSPSLVRALRSMLADAKIWSPDIPAPASQSIAAALGVAIDQLSLGMLASLGGLAVSGAAAGTGTLREQDLVLCSTLLAGTAAILVGASIGGHG